MELVASRTKRIIFKEDTHQYFVDGVEYPSVTTFIKLFHKAFDAEAISNKISDGDPIHKAKLLKDWAASGPAGTKVHNELEEYIKNKTVPKNPCIQFKAGVNFVIDMAKKGWVPLHTELPMFCEYMKLAGTADTIFVNINDPTQILLTDWKTCKNIPKVGYVQSTFIGNDTYGVPRYEYNTPKFFTPIDHLEDTKFNHYAMQLTIYQAMLELHYGYTVVGRVIVHLKHNTSRYEPMESPYLFNELQTILQYVEENNIKITK
jgi:hypothetical protein